jgi:hypothetical protein
MTALPADGPVRCLDAFTLTVTAGGELTIAGGDGASQPRSLPLFAEFVDEPSPVPSEEGTWHLGEVVPPDSRAVVALLEHRWALGLRDSMRAAGATLRHETWLDDDDRGMLESLLSSNTR